MIELPTLVVYLCVDAELSDSSTSRLHHPAPIVVVVFDGIQVTCRTRKRLLSDKKESEAPEYF